ncbi:transcription termination factor Rho [Microlunatus flavus]|nr:transcription termination factor Rho [Microlunatus flavus]
MVLPELKQLASSLGLKGTGAMRKGQLVAAIQAAQGGLNGGSSNGGSSEGGSSNGGSTRRSRRGGTGDGADQAPAGEAGASNGGSNGEGDARTRTAPARSDEIANALHELRETVPQTREPAASERPVQAEAPDSGRQDQERGERTERAERSERSERSDDDRGDGERRQRRDRQQGDGGQQSRDGGQQRDRQDDGQRQQRDQNGQNGAQNRQGDGQNRGQNNGQGNGQNRDDRNNDRANDRNNDRGGSNDYDDEAGGRRGRRRRSRDRQNRRTGGRTGGQGMDRYESEPTVNEDDVLVPARGILDVMDNYAFVRTSGYLPSPEDAYVSLAMVKKFGLRKGDVVTGQLRLSKEGESKAKFNPLVKLETVNGADPEAARNRPDFAKLTPLYPQERLKLETTGTQLATRIVDLMAPIGKGQRALIVSPPKAGKTMMMQAIANAIAANNPEVHLMVVLVDERPEEVTDFQRTVKGEVIASTFDRPAGDHTTVAELAIERAKRLVEAGKDVVILLDGITRLSRAYNLAAPASGRILSGGVDSAALYPPKKFLGAARNIEGGGSLTILATALVETGSKMDEVIFEEFKGTGNSEIRLRRDFAEKRIFPAIDVDASSTRREELLMSREELNIVWKLRRVIGGLDSLQGLETLLDRLKKTESNRDFMVAITKSMPA